MCTYLQIFCKTFDKPCKYQSVALLLAKTGSKIERVLAPVERFLSLVIMKIIMMMIVVSSRVTKKAFHPKTYHVVCCFPDDNPLLGQDVGPIVGMLFQKH